MTASSAYTWHGRRGAVLLGPTEHRVATFLEAMTRHGRITIRTADLVDRLHVERSEAYRITARLRVLGLFGIANDRSGARGGRLIWRTTTARAERRGLDSHRHHVAWARIVAWSRARRAHALSGLAALRQSRIAARPVPAARSAHGPDVVTPGTSGPSFRELMAGAGLSPALVEWWQRPRSLR